MIDTRKLWIRGLETRLPNQHIRCTHTDVFATSEHQCEQRATAYTAEGHPRCWAHGGQKPKPERVRRWCGWPGCLREAAEASPAGMPRCEHHLSAERMPVNAAQAAEREERMQRVWEKHKRGGLVSLEEFLEHKRGKAEGSL